MNERLIKIRESINKNHLDAILIHNPVNRRYISGFKGSAGVLFISKYSAVLLTDFRYIEQGTKQAPDFMIINHTDKGLYHEINQLIKKDSIKVLGFEGDTLSFSEYENLQEALNVSLASTYKITEKIRMIKDENEINNIKMAVSIADGAFTHILALLKVGVSEREIALELEYYMKRNGASDLSFSTIVASGPFSSLPHWEPGERKLRTGDFVVMDFGCIYKGYCSDMTRTVVIGKANKKQKEIYDIVLGAQNAALKAIKPLIKGKEIDKIARDYIKEKGYGQYFGHGLGHSVGMEIHENPRFSISEEEAFLPGMVVTVEPGIYIPDFGGVRIEDLVVITEKGIDNLTTSPKELFEI